MPGNAV